MISGVSSSGFSDLLAAPQQGIRRGIEQFNAAAQEVAEGNISPENVVQQISAEMLVKANVASARTAQEILGTLMDTFA